MINEANAPGHHDVVVISGTLAAAACAAIRQFARHGARIAILGHGREELEQARREAESLGGEAIALPVDVANPGEVESASSVVEKHLGPIDAWINSALAEALPTPRALDDAQRATEAAYLAVVHGTMAALKLMLPRNCGVIVQVSPNYTEPSPYSGDSGAKALIQGFCESMRAELRRDARSVTLATVEVPLGSSFNPRIGFAGWLEAPSYLATIEARTAAEAIYAAAFGHGPAAPNGGNSHQDGIIPHSMPVSPRPAGSGFH